ncbi:hypothetical protein RB195_026523 [Necator americanus]|uniref:Uncharacterized protein n=1 Tax=Necator americanus TaxID=51031 RepID=A0ABR1EWP3_NECAM
MFNEQVVFLVDVVRCRIFPKAGYHSEKMPVNDSSETSLPELCGFLFPPGKRKFSAEEAIVRFRIEHCHNSDIRQAEAMTEDDVVNFIATPSTG